MTIGDPFGPPLFPEPPERTLASGLTEYFNPYTGTYIRSKSYAQRMQRGYARGMTRQEARGHVPAVGMTEYGQRRAREEARDFAFEQRYGFKYSYWLYLRRNWVDEINEMAAPSANIDPLLVGWELQNAPQTGHNEEWIEARLAEKLVAMIYYREGNPQPGAADFRTQDGMAPIVWWYYH